VNVWIREDLGLFRYKNRENNKKSYDEERQSEIRENKIHK